ncbi:MAG: hypothetical protein ACP5NV_01005 [Candidatus Woesearchaeota archaeon]
MEHFNILDRLHTDVLEDKYGTIDAKIIKHNSHIREAHLIDKKGISRTYAITFFPKNKPANILKIDKEIKEGLPIGKAFRNHGYAIRKNVIGVFVIKIPSYLKKEFNTKENYAKARLSEFYSKKHNSSPIIYGTVVEIYAPDFRNAVINSVDMQQVNATTSSFKKQGITMNDIWDRIGENNYWNDMNEKYDKAKKSSLKEVYEMKEKIKEYIKNK